MNITYVALTGDSGRALNIRGLAVLLMHVTSTFKCRLQLCLYFYALTCCPSRRSCSLSLIRKLSQQRETHWERESERTSNWESGLRHSLARSALLLHATTHMHRPQAKRDVRCPPTLTPVWLLHVGLGVSLFAFTLATLRCLAQLYNLNGNSSNNNMHSVDGFACVFKTHLAKWPRRQRNTYTPRFARVLPAEKRERERGWSAVLVPSRSLLLPTFPTLSLFLPLSVSLSLTHLFCLYRTAVRATENHFNRHFYFSRFWLTNPAGDESTKKVRGGQPWNAGTKSGCSGSRSRAWIDIFIGVKWRHSKLFELRSHSKSQSQSQLQLQSQFK